MAGFGISARATRAIWAVACVVAGGCSAATVQHGGQNGSGTSGTNAGLGGSGGSSITAGIGGGGIVQPAAGGGAGSGGTAGTSAPITGSDQPVNIDNCPGSVSAANVSALQAAGAQTMTPMRWLYPYDATVFPRGLTAPLLQWDELGSAASDAVYLHLSSKLFDYKGCMPPTAAGQLQIPQDVWEQAGVQSRGGTDPLNVELVTTAGGKVSKLPARKLFFALAQLKNAIYYNTYGSALANQMAIAGGVVMRITPKKAQPDVFLKAQSPVNCIGCHAVSADGSKLVAEEHGQPGLVEQTGGIYDLTKAGMGTFPSPVVSLKRAGFSALYPDGSVYLTTGRPQAGPFGGTGNVTGTFGPEPSKLVDTNTGNEITGTGAPKYALMPMFSTDGKMVVFNHLADDGTGGHELAVMDFDRAGNKFSNLKSIYSDPTLHPGWPTFLPQVQATGTELATMSGRQLVFALGSNADYMTQDVLGSSTLPHVGDLWWLDLDSGKAAPLARAGGFEGSTNFMPFGDRDAHKDFVPTVSPVAAGGYFWIFFSSRRQYGNKLVYADNVGDAAAKKIWVAAIDIHAAPGSDPSHPAFFLSEQEEASGNIRAFAALSPCHVDGDSCETGIDCCSGHCLNGKCGVPAGPHCSEIDEKCTKTSDCCTGKGLSCIGGYCGIVVPQ